MFPVDPITAASLLILAAGSNQHCQIPKPAEINVVPSSQQLVIDTSKTLAEMQQASIDTINPYGYNNVTHTNGYMEGGMAVKSKVDLDYKKAQRVNGYCIWYETVAINIEINPKIVIANEVAQDRCMYKAVLEHEMKHVNVERQIANEFAQTIGRKVFDGLKQRGFIAGPIPPESAQEIIKRMRKTVSQLVEFEYKKVSIERAERQQAVDNLEEYKSVSAKCPKYKPPKSAYGFR